MRQQKPSIGLLMCNMNENEGIIRNVNACKEAFDRILILDSSSTDNHIKLKSDLSNIDKLTIQRIIPMRKPIFAKTHEIVNAIARN